MAHTKIDVHSPTEKTKQESAWRGPLELVRTKTDVKFLVAFAICFVLWIISGIYGICKGDRIAIEFDDTLHHSKIIAIVRGLYRRFNKSKYYILAFSLLSVAILTFYMMMFRWITRFLVGLTMFLLFAFIALLYFFAGRKLYRKGKGYPTLAIAIVLTIFYVLMLVSFIKANVNLVCNLMRQSCKAMFFFPSTFFVMVAQFVVQILLICFCGAVFVFLKSIRVEVEEEVIDPDPWLPAVGSYNDTGYDNDTEQTTDLFYETFVAEPNLDYVPYYVYLLHFFNFFGYVWTCCFIVGFGRMILSSTFATWYQVEDKSKIPCTTTLKCFMAILKYHAGTIAFAATPLSIFFVFYVVYEQGLDKLKGMYKRPLYVISWLLAIIKLPSDALAMSAIHGKGFYESLKDSYSLLMKNPIAFLAIETLSDYITFFGILLSPMVSTLSAIIYFYLMGRTSRRTRVTTEITVCTISFLMTLTLFMVFQAASNTIRFCYFEESKFSHESELKSYQIHADDKDAECSRPPTILTGVKKISTSFAKDKAY